MVIDGKSLCNCLNFVGTAKDKSISRLFAEIGNNDLFLAKTVNKIQVELRMTKKVTIDDAAQFSKFKLFRSINQPVMKEIARTKL